MVMGKILADWGFGQGLMWIADYCNSFATCRVLKCAADIKVGSPEQGIVFG